MAILVSIPVLSLLLILQMAIVSQATLLQGKADVVLLAIIAWALQKRVQTAWMWGIIGGLMVGFVSHLPLGVWMAGYLFAVGLALIFRQRVWQAPILAMLVTTFFGTLILHLIALIFLLVIGTPLPFFQSLNLITLPSVLLNLLLAIPIYAVIHDLAKWFHPEKLEM